MTVFDFIYGVVVLIVIAIVIIYFIGARYGIVEADRQLEQQDKLIRNLNEQLKESYKNKRIKTRKKM